jgi:hypothetical protein
MFGFIFLKQWKTLNVSTSFVFSNRPSKTNSPCEKTREERLTDSRRRTPNTKHIAQRITHHHGHSHGLGVEIPAHVEHQHEKRINHNERDADPLVQTRIIRLG